MSDQAKTRVVGRSSRLILGLVMLGSAAYLTRQATAVFYLQALALALGLLVFFILAQWIIIQFSIRLPNWAGILLTHVPPGLLLVAGFPGGLIFGEGEGLLAFLLYVGISLVIAAWQAMPGCEVTALPAMIFRRHARFPCVLFTPIDTLEQKKQTKVSS